MYQKALLIINGNKDVNEKQKQLNTFIQVWGTSIVELVIRQAQSKEDVRKTCASIDEQVEAVFIAGGDGTIHESINGLMESPYAPDVGVLPYGTCNDFSRSLGLAQNPKRAMTDMLEKNTKEIDIGSMNDRFFANFYGIGLIVETSENIDENLKGAIGKLSYFISTLQTVQNPEVFSYQMKIDGESYTGEAVMILIMNGHSIGTNQVPVGDTSMQDEQFEIFIVPEGGNSLMREFFATMGTKEIDNENSPIEHVLGKNIELTTDPVKQADTDGEVYTETPVKINLGEKKVRFLVSGTPAE
ncbi:diacylglycerol/lipid kinase family protein [Marinococcus halotolerans]|uniref:diacylglycerol/lipid kinase family protein n=1 Tax=Marinococcus halotolerans TaxID=301092 RepID=UPI0003B46ED9|nr:YegS/Rv2252/BmrU family lipid kinase [Marinococcus halotolerans]